jgi:hypothetical protein
MEMPFVYGKLAGETEFTNRNLDTAHLTQNFIGGVNTILISPRRWGKSSLVAHAVSVLQKKNKNIRVCQLDLYSTRNEEEFYAQYSAAVLSACSNKLEEAMDFTRRFLSRFIPKLSVSTDPDSAFSLGLDWKEVKKDPPDILT